MSVPKPKPPEVLQAQAAAFAHEAVDNPESAQRIYLNMAELAINDAGNPQPGPSTLSKFPKTYSRYARFLHNVGGRKHEGVRERARMLDEYSRFEPAIAELEAQLDTELPQDHEAFLSSGTKSSAFQVEVDDKKYAIRGLEDREHDTALAVDQRLAAGILTKGVPHTEQIVAASYKDRKIVAELAPGKPINSLSLEDLENIPDDQIDDLAETAITVANLGLLIDPNPNNLFYDPKEGFTIIDIGPKTGPVVHPGLKKVSTSSVISSPVWSLYSAASQEAKGLQSATDYERDYEIIHASARLVKVFTQAIEKKLQGDELLAITGGIGKITNLQSPALEMTKEEYVVFREELARHRSLARS